MFQSLGDEYIIGGKVYEVVLSAGFVLTGKRCLGCVADSNIDLCISLSVKGVFVDNCPCGLEDHLIYKLKGDNDVQV